jgi:hypothetical protein
MCIGGLENDMAISSNMHKFQIGIMLKFIQR